MRPSKLILLTAVALTLFGSICYLRETGYADPNHDEAIALLASKGLEREYAKRLQQGLAPFHRVERASQWHAFTTDFRPIPFREIREDVQACDKHPPLAFWMFNRWLSLFREGGYRQAVVLTCFQVVVAAVLLGFAVFRRINSIGLAIFAFTVFLLGNSAIITAIFVRQYALFAACYAAVIVLVGELCRRDLSLRWFAVDAFLLGAVCTCGVMTQYTFVTMSIPIHIALMVALAVRKDWGRFVMVGGSYLLAGIVFFTLNAGAIDHARAVSGGLKQNLQLGAALWGVPQMVIPWPSFLPAWITWSVGAVLLVAILGLAIYLCYDSRKTIKFASDCAILSGMIGAGLLQFSLVALGFFPGWATGPHHFGAFWMLTVFAVAITLSKQDSRWLRSLVALGLAVMLAMQVFYGFHCHRLLPRVNVSYAASLRPNLICIDNLARGMVLELTDVISSDQMVLVTAPDRLQQHLSSGGLSEFALILYLPMDETARQAKHRTIEVAKQAGWGVTELPVVHPGLYDAVVFER